ncbi:MAG: hypothetical protein ABMA26_07465 [Limisphaerales bacterium]
MTVELLIERVIAVGLLVIGLSHWLRAQMWADLLESWRQNRFLPFFLGWLYLTLGTVIALGHNVWAWDVTVIVTLLGWAWTLKGILYLLWPDFLVRILERRMTAGQNHARKFALAGGFMAVVGSLLVWRVFLQ